MDDLKVTPEYLEQLAQCQDRAQEEAADTRETTARIRREVKTTHGVISTPSNEQIDNAEEKRKRAVDSVANASARLAASLRALKEEYLCVDADSSHLIDRQLGGR